MEVYIKHSSYWMTGYKPCSHEGDPKKKKRGNKNFKLNNTADGNMTYHILPDRNVDYLKCLNIEDFISFYRMM